MFKDSLKRKGQVRRPLTLYVGEEDGCCASKNMGGGCSECCIVALLRLAQQAGMTFQPSTIPNRERGKKKKKDAEGRRDRGEEEERVVSTTLSLLLAFTWPFSSLTKQPGWS